MPLPPDHDLYPIWEDIGADFWRSYINAFLGISYLKNAGDSIAMNDWIGAKDALWDAADYLAQGFWFITGYSYSGVEFPLLTFLSEEYDYWGGEVDMDAIINAMLQAEYEQLQKFIGIEDAYRSAIWDQPFNAEFYAALARGFRP